MKSQELPIYRASWDMVKQMEHYIRNFPREAKYSHGAKLRELGIDFVRVICLANECRDKSVRLAYLDEAVGILEAYRFTKRLAMEFKYLSLNQAAKVDVHLASVGQQLGGWRNKMAGQSCVG